MQLYADGQAALTTLENQWKGYLQTPYQDFILKCDDGSSSGLLLINKTSLSGVVVVDGPNFTEADGPEYVNQRNMEFALEAEYVFPGAETWLVSYTETISMKGNGGPRYVPRFPFNYPAINQLVSPTSLIITVQQGKAVGHTKYPEPAKPFAGRTPGLFVNDAEAVVRETPRSIGKGYVEYPISWNYEWRTIKPLSGVPSLPPLAN